MKKIIYTYLITVLFFTFLPGCIDDPEPQRGILNVTAPVVTIRLVDLQATAVILEIDVQSEGGAPVTKHGICWSSSDDNPTIMNDTIVTGSGKETLVVTVNDLIPDTEYNFRAFAINSATIGYSETQPGSTIEGLGLVRTLAPVDITATTAQCGGKIDLPGEIEIIERGVMLKDLTLAADDPAAIRIIEIKMETDSFYCTVSDLIPNTKYYVEAYVKDKLERYYVHNGDSVKFSTPSGLPKIGALTIEKEYTSAVLKAEVISEGDAPVTEKGFLFGRTDKPEIDGDSLVVGGPEFEYKIESLKPNEKYYLRAYVTNSFGSDMSELDSFYTKSDVPIMALTQKGEPENGAVTLKVKLEEFGQLPFKEAGICWDTKPFSPAEYKNVNFSSVLLNHDREAEFILENMIGGETYYIYSYSVMEDERIGHSSRVTITAPDRFKIKTDFAGDAGNHSAAFVLNNIVYIVGGSPAHNECTNQFVTYNSSSNLCKKFGVFDEPIELAAACSYGEAGYIMGGKNSKGEIVDLFYSYSERNGWNSLGTLPDSLSEAIAYVNSSFLYLIGGKNKKGNVTNAIYEYNISSGQWNNSPIVTLNQAISNGVAFEYDNKVYMGLGNTKKLWYTTIPGHLTNWIPVEESFPEGVSTAVVYDGKVYMIDQDGRICSWDPETSVVNRRGTFPKERMLDYHMFVLQDTIYILGQSHNYGSIFITYDPVWDPVVD